MQPNRQVNHKVLEEDKSYTRHVVEYHRKHPNKRNDGVTVTWSTADYVAMAIAKQNLQGEWAKPTDQLSFLPTTSSWTRMTAFLRDSANQQHYCSGVLEQNTMIARPTPQEHR